VQVLMVQSILSCINLCFNKVKVTSQAIILIIQSMSSIGEQHPTLVYNMIAKSM
jgi:hypothetical protein